MFLGLAQEWACSWGWSMVDMFLEPAREYMSGAGVTFRPLDMFLTVAQERTGCPYARWPV